MAEMDFPAQIEYLLFSGDLEGDEVLNLYHLLTHGSPIFEQGRQIELKFGDEPARQHHNRTSR